MQIVPRFGARPTRVRTFTPMPRLFPACVLSTLLLAHAGFGASAEKLEFNRDIRPILSENCLSCHGQDAHRREAKLRLDDRESVTRDRDGYAVIVPGKPADSELLLRLASEDPDEKMPPQDSNKHVTPEQIALIRRWVAEGAVYQKHWAFEPPRQAPPPAVRGATWPRHALDRFVLARLEREGLAPSAVAAPETWLRRASFDLTGLPPTPAELDAFTADVAARGEPACDAAVERLLASPHFGERQAIDWLDAARYADTHGFNNDSARTMWRWRDWVIGAFNANLPYDRFITEQLAGDLLPKPTLEQRIATGFGRNHVINSEGGIIEEEYRVEYVADRVRTMSTAWLGLTMECSRCHDHKFDPVTQRDYYRLFAFFNNVPEQGEDGRVANAVPMIPAPTPDQAAVLAGQERQLAALDARLRRAGESWRWQPEDRARVEALIARAAPRTEVVPSVPLLEPEMSTEGAPKAEWRINPEKPAPKIATAKLDFAGKEGITLALWLNPDADNPSDVALLSSVDHLGSPADALYGNGREVRLIDGEIELRLTDRFPAYSITVRTVGANIRAGEWRHVAATYAGGKRAGSVRLFVDGAESAVRVYHEGVSKEPSSKRDLLVGADNAKDGMRWRGAFAEMISYPRALDGAAIHARFSLRALSQALDHATGDALTARERAWLRDAVLADDPATAETAAQRAELWQEHLALRRSLPSAMVMEELSQPRPAFVLNRGRYDAPGEPVDAGVPEALLAPWPAGAPRSRLGLARWLTQPNHPLVARVVVNRFWAQLFGTGLVKTLEDFGSQGEWPSHPELLDWLARDFVDGGWDVKRLLKTLVLSATYRQGSAVAPELQARDPENRLLARGPRVRLPAELIRDQALAVSGLLAPRLGGPSVYPYQPEKLYEGIVVGADYPGTRWGKSTGEDLHRRSLYTFWKRTIPHPAMTGFDAPDREFCTVRRSRTNTPLQALTLWNEPGYLEAARQLGTRMLREGGAEDDARVAFAFRLATGRRPVAAETRVLARALGRLRADFLAHGNDAYAFVKVGESALDATLPPAELAAATAVANMILSLDETITKN